MKKEVSKKINEVLKKSLAVVGLTGLLGNSDIAQAKIHPPIMINENSAFENANFINNQQTDGHFMINEIEGTDLISANIAVQQEYPVVAMYAVPDLPVVMPPVQIEMPVLKYAPPEILRPEIVVPPIVKYAPPEVMPIEPVEIIKPDVPMLKYAPPEVLIKDLPNGNIPEARMMNIPAMNMNNMKNDLQIKDVLPQAERNLIPNMIMQKGNNIHIKDTKDLLNNNTNNNIHYKFN